MQLHVLVHFAKYRRHHLFSIDRQAYDRRCPFGASARSLHAAGDLDIAVFYAKSDTCHLAFNADIRYHLLPDDACAVRFAYSFSFGRSAETSGPAGFGSRSSQALSFGKSYPLTPAR